MVPSHFGPGALSLLQTIYKISQSFFALLQYAEAVNSGCAASIISSAGAAPPLLRNEQFVCEKLRLKIMRQISDPIVVCSRDFPQWLAVIGQEFQFLLPCECRSAMLHAMSFNVYRSLHALVTKHTDANSDVRVSRIPRQQVRPNCSTACLVCDLPFPPRSVSLARESFPAPAR